MAKLSKEIIIAGITIDRQSETPVYKQVYQEFRNSILNRRFQPGEQLPPTRDLSVYLGVSRTTVVLAFEHLMLEGYIKGRRGAGTYISDEIPEHLLFANFAGSESLPLQRRAHPQRIARGAALAGYLNRERLDYHSFQPFKPGVPDLRNFPFHLWGKLLARAADGLPAVAMGYSSSAGYKPLRNAIAGYLRIARSVNCSGDQVIITSGSQQGINLVCRVLLKPGDTVGFEDPGYAGAWDILAAAGAEVMPVAMDDEGIDLRQINGKPSLLYITPSHHYPLGITMSLNRRLELLDYANSTGAWILEDDYDSEYRYNGLPLSSLQGIDSSGSVIYMGTFSKVMFPGIRLGYLVVPEELLDAFTAARLLSDRNSPIIGQAALEEFLTAGHYGRHIRKMRLLYQQRKEVFYYLAEKHLSGHLTLHPTEAGLHTVAWLSGISDDSTFARRMLEAGIITPPLSAYSQKACLKPGLVLGYAAYPEKQIEQAILGIRRVLG